MTFMATFQFIPLWFVLVTLFLVIRVMICIMRGSCCCAQGRDEGVVTQNNEKRRKLILRSIIIKKAVSSECTDLQTCPSQNDVEQGRVADPSDSKTSKLPDEVTKSIDSGDGAENKQKENILVDTIRSITLSVSEAIGNLSNGLSDASLPPMDEYSDKSCPICLEKYAAGEEICWSKNDKCVHVFHLECMLAWLIQNDNCPLCRENYLYSGSH